MRITALLQSTAWRQSRRLAVACVATGVAALGALRISESSRGGMAGLQSFVIAGLCIALILAIRCGCDSVGDRESGLLDLLRLAGTDALTWTSVRVLQLATAFLAMWCVRIPFLVFLFTLGGIRPSVLAAGELLICIIYVGASAITLMNSHKASSHQQAAFVTVFVLIAWELALSLPALSSGLLSRYAGVTMPDAVRDAFSLIAQAGMLRTIRLWPTRPTPLVDLWPAACSYLLLTFGAVLRFIRLVNSDPSADARPEPGGRRSRSTSRPRCWGDALAWQAYAVHSGGTKILVTKCVVLSGIGLATLMLAAWGYHDIAVIVCAGVAALLLLFCAAKPSDCLTREIRDKSLSTLWLTPHSPREFYAGWRRGALRLSWPELVFTGGVCAAMQTYHRYGLMLAATAASAIYASGPFLLLSPLVPASPRGLVTGMGLILGLILIGVACVTFAVAVSPLTIPIVLAPLLWAYNWFVTRELLPYWLSRKLSTME